MPRYHKLARKNAIHVAEDIMTVEEAAAILMHMKLADNLINPMNRPDVPGQPTLPSNTLTPLVEGKPPPEKLHPMENSGKPETHGLHPNRLKSLPKSYTPTAMDERAARAWFVRNMDIDTTASAKGESSGRTPNDDRMDVDSTTQTRDQVDIHSNSMVSRTSDSASAGAGLANQNQAEVIKIEEGSKPKWRLCSYCGVPGHPIANCPMVPCRRCHTVGHAPKNCPLIPCKYCKTTGQHAIGKCPVVLAKRARDEQLRNIKIAARTSAATTTIKKKPTQEEKTSLKRGLVADDKEEEEEGEEEYANEFVSINSQRGLAKETSMQSPSCDQPRQHLHRTRSRSRTNLPCGYCHATGHLTKHCPVAKADRNEWERASSAPQRKKRYTSESTVEVKEQMDY